MIHEPGNLKFFRLMKLHERKCAPVNDLTYEEEQELVRLKQQFMVKERLSDLVHAKIAWLSTWKGCENENGFKHKMLSGLMNDSLKVLDYFEDCEISPFCTRPNGHHDECS